MTTILIAQLAAACSLFGLAVILLGAVAVAQHARRTPGLSRPLPPVSVLCPLYGEEPGLAAALGTLCAQRYGQFQIIFGVHSAGDPALEVVRKLAARHPQLDIQIAINGALHGANRKVSNLINMLPYASYDTLVFSDSDLHLAPDYLASIAESLAEPGVGLVTTVCTGLATAPGVAGRLGALRMTQSFLPGALLARWMGRQDCLGTTMALTRQTLSRAGGLMALVDHLAEDNVLGQQVRRLGLGVALARTVPATGVAETTLHALWQHELRWARTISSLEPVAFAASALQFPLFWSTLAEFFAGGAPWSLALGALVWAVRSGAAWAVLAMLPRPGRQRALWRDVAAAILLVHARDLLCVAEVAGSFFGSTVIWRGHVMTLEAGRVSPAPLRSPSAG